MSSAPLPPPRRQAYRATLATPPRTPPLGHDKPFPHLPVAGNAETGASGVNGAEERAGTTTAGGSGTVAAGVAAGAAGSSVPAGSNAAAVDTLSAAEMEDHLAAFESLGPPGASRRPTRRVRSIERTWTWVKSRSSVYGEQSLVNGNLDADEEDEDNRELPLSASTSNRPMTMATAGNAAAAVTASDPRRNSSTGLDPDERRRRRQGILPDWNAVNGLRPPPRPLPRPPSRSSVAPTPAASETGRSESSSRSGLDLSRDTLNRELESLEPQQRDRPRERERPRPLPVRPLPAFPAGPESESPVEPTFTPPPLPRANSSNSTNSGRSPQASRAATPSIHDIVNRHSSAVAQATEDVKDRARAELALRPDLLATARTRKKSMASPTAQSVRRVGGMTPPPATPPKLEPLLKLEPAPDSPGPPSSTTPTMSPVTTPTAAPAPTLPPGAAPPAPAALPVPARSTHRRRQSSKSTTVSTDTSDSYVNEIRFARAAYDHLTPPPTTPTPPSTGPAPQPTLTPPPATGITPQPRMIFSPTPEHSPRAKSNPRDRDSGRSQTQSPDFDGRKGSNGSLNRSKSTSPMLPEDDSHAIALYLRSPQLNRNLLIARPYPERPLQVSVADLGKPDGRPVVVFLGLGCVRYLIALYDDLARALGLRLICIDRWGLGRTDQIPQNQRGLLDWADVVRRVLDELGVDRFQVLAHSAGAPYALATVLKMERRVHGKIHLLAPWVGGDVEGYRWLKWVPNSVIKSALAAEWRLESYFLGKAPTIKHSIRSKSEAMMSSTSLDSDGAPSRASLQDGIPRPDSRLGAVEVDGFDTLASDLYPAPTGWTTTPPSVTITSVSASPGFTQALMQASHAESLSGTTADLLSVVLGRDAKPWGFSYTDIRHPCKIWYGAEDERVSEKSMRWMERAMDAELHVVPGEGHNLMSSRVVMFDVLDSLAEDIF